MYKRNWTHNFTPIFFVAMCKSCSQKIFFWFHFSNIEHWGLPRQLWFILHFSFWFWFRFRLIARFNIFLNFGGGGHKTICDVSKRLLLFSRKEHIFSRRFIVLFAFVCLFVCLTLVLVKWPATGTIHDSWLMLLAAIHFCLQSLHFHLLFSSQRHFRCCYGARCGNLFVVFDLCIHLSVLLLLSSSSSTCPCLTGVPTTTNIR